MDETLEDARARDRLGREIEVLILVKTTPNPSATYEDTVCVAGLALAPGPLRWVRLYPVPFRHLHKSTRFTKYAVIRTRVAAPRTDPRAESLRVTDASRITVVRQVDRWRERCDLILLMEETTACALNAGTRADPNATSLGIVRPHNVTIDIQPSTGWSPSQQRAIDKWRNQDTLPLNGLAHNAAPPLEHPPLDAWYKYACAEPGCPGRHRQGISDWELTAVQRRARADGVDVEQRVRERFYDVMFRPDRQQRFILGNNARAGKRGSFSVLSVFWPPAKDVSDSLNVLF